MGTGRETANDEDSLRFVIALDTLLMRIRPFQRDLFRGAKLTPMQLFALHWLSTEKHTNAAAFAKRMGVRLQTVKPVIDELVGSDLVKRVPSPVDRRTTLLVVTQLGLRLLRTTRAAHVKSLGRVLHDLPPERLAAAAEALDTISDSLLPR